MTLPRLIIVAGPAGSGKTTWAMREAGCHPDNFYPTDPNSPGVIHTDNFLHLDRSKRVAYTLHLLQQPGCARVIIEGCESLRLVSKARTDPHPGWAVGLCRFVDRVIWIDGYEKPGTSGLTTQQRKYLEQLKEVLPRVEVVPGKPKGK